MKPRRASFKPKTNVTVSANRVAAFAKAGTAPIETLTDAMVESIAASHARRGTPAFDTLRRELFEVVNARRAMAGG